MLSKKIRFHRWKSGSRLLDGASTRQIERLLTGNHQRWVFDDIHYPAAGGEGVIKKSTSFNHLAKLYRAKSESECSIDHYVQPSFHG